VATGGCGSTRASGADSGGPAARLGATSSGDTADDDGWAAGTAAGVVVDAVVEGLSSNAKCTQTGLSTAVRRGSPGGASVASDAAAASCSRTQMGLSSRNDGGGDTSTDWGSSSGATAAPGGTRPSRGLSRGDSTWTKTGLSLGGRWTRPGGDVGVVGWNGLAASGAGRGRWAPARRDNSGDALAGKRPLPRSTKPSASAGDAGCRRRRRRDDDTGLTPRPRS